MKVTIIQLLVLIYILFSSSSVHASIKLEAQNHLILMEGQQWKLIGENNIYKLKKELMKDTSLLMGQFAWDKLNFELNLQKTYDQITKQISHNNTEILVKVTDQYLTFDYQNNVQLVLLFTIYDQLLNISNSQSMTCPGKWSRLPKGNFLVDSIECQVPRYTFKKKLLRVKTQNLDKQQFKKVIAPILNEKECKKIEAYYLYSCDSIKRQFVKDPLYDYQLSHHQSTYFANNYTLEINQNLEKVSHNQLLSFIEKSLNDNFFYNQRVNFEFEKQLLQSPNINLFLNVEHLSSDAIDTIRKHTAGLLLNQYPQASITPILSKKAAYVQYLESRTIILDPESVNTHLTINLDLRLIDSKLHYSQSFYKGSKLQTQFGFQEKKNNPKTTIVLVLLSIIFILACFSIISRISNRENK